MKRVSKVLMAAGLAWVTCLGLSNASAQDNTNSGDNNSADRGNRRNRFGGGDPSQFRQMRLDGYRDELEVKDDAEWNAIKPLIEKVMDAQQTVFSDRVRGFMRGFGGGGGFGRGGGDNNGGDQGGRRRGGGGGGFGGFGDPSPEAQELQKAIESKASNSEVKAALAKFVQ